MIEIGRMNFRITGTGAQRRLIRLPPGPNGFVRYAFLRAVTANTATASLYVYGSNPVDTSGNLLGGTTDYGVVTAGVDPATVPAEHTCYAVTGQALTQSATASSIGAAVATNIICAGPRVVMVDMTAATGAWDVLGFFSLGVV